MKRRWTLLLAALMLTSCLSPALAAEGGAEPGTPAGTAEEEQGLYAWFGPWGEWTGEERAAAEGWTEEAWDAYWEDYALEAGQAYEQYYYDLSAWEETHYEQERSEREEELRRERTSMGMPYPDGPNVSLDGAYLDFGGAEPFYAEESAYTVMIPFRPFLEALGAEVGFRDGTASAVLPDGRRLEVEPDGGYLTCTRDGTVYMARMSAAPAVRDGAVYVDAQALAEVLDLDCHRDYYGTVKLADLTALKTEIDGGFTHMNALLAAALAAADPAKTYASTLEIEAAGTLYGDKEHHTATAEVRAVCLTGPKGASTDTSVKVDLGGMAKLLQDGDGRGWWYAETLTDRLAEIDGARIRTIADYEGGSLYTKGSMSGGGAYSFAPPQDVWIRTGLSSHDVSPFHAAPVGGYTVGGLLMEASYSEDDLRSMAEFCALFVGDGVLTAETVGTTTTYRADVDQAALGRGLKALMEEYGAGDVPIFYDYAEEDIEALAASSGFHLTMEARVREGRLLDMDFGVEYRTGGVFPAAVSVTLSGTSLSIEGGMSVVGGWLGRLDLSLTAESRVTDEAAPTAPPAGEPVKEYGEAYQAWLDGWAADRYQ